MPEAVSGFALAFGEKRLKEVYVALRKLSPSLESEISREAGRGGLFERMGRASAALARLASEVGSGGGEPGMVRELSKSMGKSFSPAYARAVLGAHSQGLSHLATAEGLGAAIFLHFSAGFRKNLVKHAQETKADPEVAASAVQLLDTWVRSLLVQSAPDDPDDPIRGVSSMEDEEAAARWCDRLCLRCTQLTEDERVRTLVLGSFRSKA